MWLCVLTHIIKPHLTMKNSFAIFLLLAANSIVFSQRSFNHSFEESNHTKDWDLSFKNGGAMGYLIHLDSSTAHDGRYSLSIEPDPAVKDRKFGACFTIVPADFQGKNITLKAFLKTENIPDDGMAGLWMRIDGDGRMLAFDNMQNRPVKGSTGWTEYTISLPLPEESEKVNIGGLMTGTGKMWVDNFRLFVDDKPFAEAKDKKLTIYAAQLDTVFDHGSGIHIGNLTPELVADLALLGKVWGFLKYYHPKIAAGELNWDYELFRFLPEYLKTSNESQRDELLAGWITSLGELPECKICPEKPEGEYHIAPDLIWLNDAKLSENLRKQLHYVLERRNQQKHYYLAFHEGVGNPNFKNENAYKQFTYPDDGFRLLAVYRYWNIIQYFFPYRDIIGEDWHGIMPEFIPKFLAAKDALSYKLAAREMIGRVNDTHANLWMQDEEIRGHFGRLYPPFQIKFIENQAVVTDYYNKPLGEQSGIQIGDVITAVDGMPVEEMVKKMKPMYPASNEPTKLRDIAKNLLRGNDSTFALTVQRDGATLPMVVRRFDAKSNGLDLGIDWAHHKPDSCYRLLSPEVGYIYLGNIQQHLLPAIFEKFKNTKGIVIDIRNYPAQFVVFSLGKYLLPKPTEFVRFTNGSIEFPGLFRQTPILEVGEKNEDFYKGKVVILINELTQSQAEYTTMAFRTAPQATVIGSTTAAADGNVSNFSLPGGLNTMITGIGVFYPDGKPTQRVGILPDIEMKPTIAGTRAGRDELLEKAFEVIMGEKRVIRP